MGCFCIGCFGAIFGRVAVLALWIIGWFGKTGIPLIWMIVGIVFAPLTLLCVGCINYFYGGQWGLFQIILLVICLLIDLRGDGSPLKKNKNKK